ncbi:MAG: hypothetical protein GF313_11760 [Caldithrix sp.]|nr:hypothetical protein [Caldithrix sp.]
MQKNIVLFMQSMKGDQIMERHRKYLKILFFIAIPQLVWSQVILNEILFDVDGADYHEEFVEIYNLSEAATNLSGWAIADSQNIDAIVDAGGELMLAGHQYAVILDGSYFGNSDVYDDVIPEEALIVKIDGNAFLRSGLPNSKPATLFLINADSTVVQTYRYTIDNAPGHSEEKRSLTVDNSQQNWGNSLVAGGTPGMRNSLLPDKLDLGFYQENIQYHPTANLLTGQTIYLETAIENVGLEQYTGPLRFTVFIDRDRDSVFNNQDQMVVDWQNEVNIQSGDTIQFKGQWTPEEPDNYLIIAEIQAPKDENESNDRLYLQLRIFEGRQTLIINEINFLGGGDRAEWIELYNKGSQPVQLDQWSISDGRDTARINLTLAMSPDTYFVISEDTLNTNLLDVDTSNFFITSDFPTLNNQYDIIYLLNPAGAWIEQVAYEEDWLEGETWRMPSLERIYINGNSRERSNWGPSTAAQGSTPTRKNSIQLEQKPVTTHLSVHPNPFSPDGDGYEDHTLISLQMPAETARMQVEIFDIQGRKVRTLLDNTFTGSHAEVIWNGRDDKNKVVAMGIYIIYVEVLDDSNGMLKQLKESVVVARKL